MDDLTSVRRLKRGDIDALGVLAERYQLSAVRAAYLITRDHALADDAMQEAFVRAYRSISTFDERRPFAPWLMRIVANCAIEAAQRGRRTMSLDAEQYDGASLLEKLIDHAPPLDEHAAEDEVRRAVWTALEALPPAERAAIVLRYYFDFSERELADTLGAPQGTISYRLHSARKRLRILLRPLQQEG